MEQHYRHSSFREKLIEHLFVSELLAVSWRAGDCSLEIAKPEVDNRGYDIVLERYGVIRHVQLKTSLRGKRKTSQNVHAALAEKPSGCIVWIEFDEDSLALGPFLFFGASPGAPLPPIDQFRVAKHVKANATGIKLPRPAIRVVPRGKFRGIHSVGALVEALFDNSDATSTV